MTGSARRPGMHFALDNRSRYAGVGDFDVATDAGWNYVGTFDNNATIMQLRFLARVIAALDGDGSTAYHAAFDRGIEYIGAAQYPNGGWPQVWPLAGGYHDAITCNDNATTQILGFLRDVVKGTNGFEFVPAPARERAGDSFRRGLDCVLTLQVLVNGRRTAWAQQYDILTLEPTSARNYEMPSLASSESAAILMFLMKTTQPSPAVIRAVHDGAAWFEKTRIHDVAYRNSGNQGPLLVPMPGGGPIWSRYYEVGTNRPIFGDRDKTIHDDVNEISTERRIGYAWYVDSGRAVLEEYSRWRLEHPVAP